MIEFLQQPWPWYVSGIMIAAIMFVLLYFGKSFGFSSNLRAICAASGGGKYVPFFKYDWRAQQWNLLFLVGAMIGGFIAATWLWDHQPVQITNESIAEISTIGFSASESV